MLLIITCLVNTAEVQVGGAYVNNQYEMVYT